MQEKNEICVQFSLRFIQVMRKSKMKQKDLAKELNISEQTICKYKKGDRMPDSVELYKLAAFFGVTMDWLLGGDEQGCESLWKKRALDAESKLAQLNDVLPLIGSVNAMLNKIAADK